MSVTVNLPLLIAIVSGIVFHSIAAFKKLQSDNEDLIQQTFEQHEDILELYRFVRLAEKELRISGFGKEVNEFIKKHQHLEEVPF